MTKLFARTALTSLALLVPVTAFAADNTATTAPSHKQAPKKHHKDGEIKKQAPTTAPTKAPTKAPDTKPPAAK